MIVGEGWFSWVCPGHVQDIAECPHITQTVCPVWIFEYQFDGAIAHVATIHQPISKNIDLFIF